MKKHGLLVGVMLGMALFLSAQVWAGGFEGKMVIRNGRIDLTQVEVPGLKGAQPTPQFATKAVALPFDTYRQVIKEVGKNGPGVRVHTEVVWVKGSLFRTDTQEKGDKVAIIFDAKTQKMTTISFKDKRAMVIDVGKMMKGVHSVAEEMGKTFGLDANAMKKMMQGENEAEEQDQFSLKPTGKKKKINGFKCELYAGTDEDGNPLQVWLTTPSPDIKRMFSSLEEMSKAIQKETQVEDKKSEFFEKLNKIPVLTKWVEDNSDFYFNEFVSVKKQSVSSDLFTVPKGFKVVSLSDMFKNQMMKFQQLQNNQK